MGCHMFRLEEILEKTDVPSRALNNIGEYL